MFEYCSKCETGECEYPEVEYFINSLNKKKDCNYKFIGCPDKKKEKDVPCTADLQYYDNVSGDILTIEVKRVLYGFQEDDKNENKIIALMYGMFKIYNIINDVLCELPDNIYNELSQNHKIEIPASQLYKHEYNKFREEFLEYISKVNIYNINVSGDFRFKRKENVIKIKIIKLSNDEKFKFENTRRGVLFQFPAKFSSTGGMTIEEVQKQAYDFQKFFVKIIKGLEKAENSFEGIKKNRIVLEVIVMKYGMEVFWEVPYFSDNRKFLSVVKEILKNNRDDLADRFDIFHNAYLLFNYGDKMEVLTII
ncbi:hypothetical protein AAGC94_10605 [Clostridium sporogenes]|uniref:hypothetical protein n=1 Tax=Clostridium sporogenes TaxID=1509 RepID=UPI00313B680E